MRLRSLFCLLPVAFLLLLPVRMRAQEVEGAWQAVGGPVGFVTHLVADPAAPDFLFAFVAQAIPRNDDRTQAWEGWISRAWAPYFSTNGGDSWQAASNDLAHVQPTFLAWLRAPVERPLNTLWVGTQQHGLWRSDNSGRSWRPALVRGMGDEHVAALTVDRNGRLHLLTRDNARYPSSYHYTSVDGGYNWSRRVLQRFTGNPLNHVTDLIADPFEVNRLYAVTLGGMLYSADAGFTWTQAAITLPENAFPGGETAAAVDPTQRGRLYLVNRSTNLDATDQLGVYRSLNSGVTWDLLPARIEIAPARPVGADGIRPEPAPSPQPLRLRLDPMDRRQLFLVTNAGLWVSADAGMSWRLAGVALEGVSLVDVYSHPQRRGRWYTAGAGGVWRSANAGGLWRSANTGLPPTASLRSMISAAGPPATLLAVNGSPMTIPAGHQPLWRSTDGGTSWLPAMRGLAGRDLFELQAAGADANTVYGLAFGGVAATTDAGQSWSFVTLPFTPTGVAVTDRGLTAFLSGVNGVWQTTDQGRSWRASALTNPTLAVAVRGAHDLFAIASDARPLSDRGEGAGVGQLWRSSDGGQRWENIGPLPAGEVSQLLVHPTISGLLVLQLRWGGLHISLDDGRTWTRSDTGIPAGARWLGSAASLPDGPTLVSLYFDPADPLRWWASRDAGGVFASADNGRNWVDAGADLGDNLVLDIVRHEGRLLASTLNLGLIERRPSASAQLPPMAVDARIEILWPHDYAPVTTARLANLGLRLYNSRTQEAPPCAWTPAVELWMARDAEPLRRLGLASQRAVGDHPFPFWEMNDVDVSWANAPGRKLVFMARVNPGQAESFSSLWIHAADARTFLPQPPTPTGLTTATPAAVDAVIRVVWPHDEAGRFVEPSLALQANISALLFERDTTLALADAHLPERVWLIGALDNQVGRRLAAGEATPAQGEGFRYTTYEFNNIDVSLARNPDHSWTFWLEAPGADAATNVWVHGIDSRTRAPILLEPIAGCKP